VHFGFEYPGRGGLDGGGNPFSYQRCGRLEQGALSQQGLELGFADAAGNEMT
jgi:hypothetical protein